MFRPPDVDGLAAILWERFVVTHDRCRGTGYLVEDSDDLLLSRTTPCTCNLEVRFHCALLAANVPREFWTVEGLEFERNVDHRATVEEYTLDLAAARRTGRGFLMAGSNGVGKTASACVVLCRAARAGYSIGYVTVHDFVTSTIPASRDPDLDRWRRDLLEAEFLVLDEVGKEHKAAGSEFVTSELDSLLRWRRGEFRPTVLCTNLEPRDFAAPDRYGASLWSIVRDRVEVLKFRDGDFRTELKRRKR
jgi:DNA replication protein DnaC